MAVASELHAALMISFMISEVPAKIRWMRALAYILQIGYSHM